MFAKLKSQIKVVLRRHGLAIPSREQALADEVQFWDRWLSTRGLDWPDDYRYRIDPRSQLDTDYWPLIEHVTHEPVRILDVGAGPLTALGKNHPSKMLDIVATDLLADQYALLLQKHSITPLVTTVFADVERLSEQFQEDTFDLIVARNCIDHVSDPVEAILQMLRVVRHYGYIMLFHNENEADHQMYEQLHQWNFTHNQGDFIIRGSTYTVNINRLLEHIADVSCSLKSPYVKVYIRKQ